MPSLSRRRSEQRPEAFIARHLAFLRSQGRTAEDASEALGRHFPAEQIAAVRREQEGELGHNAVLAALVKHAAAIGLPEAELRLRYQRLSESLSEVRQALGFTLRGLPYYVGVLGIVAVAVAIILLIFVIPQFEALFKGFGADLPAFTRMVIGVSRGAPLLIAVLAGLVIWLLLEETALTRILRHERVPDWYSWRRFSFGRIARRQFDILHLWLVELLLAAQHSPQEALRIAAEIMRDVSPKLTIDGTDSSSLHSNLEVSAQLGTLEREVRYLTEHIVIDLPARVDAQVRLLSSGLQIALGVMIGALVIAMYMPIFKLGAAI
jgi:type IV pilus assembly protein PilC